MCLITCVTVGLNVVWCSWDGFSFKTKNMLLGTPIIYLEIKRTKLWYIFCNIFNKFMITLAKLWYIFCNIFNKLMITLASKITNNFLKSFTRINTSWHLKTSFFMHCKCREFPGVSSLKNIYIYTITDRHNDTLLRLYDNGRGDSWNEFISPLHNKA